MDDIKLRAIDSGLGNQNGYQQPEKAVAKDAKEVREKPSFKDIYENHKSFTNKASFDLEELSYMDLQDMVGSAKEQISTMDKQAVENLVEAYPSSEIIDLMKIQYKGE